MSAQERNRPRKWNKCPERSRLSLALAMMMLILLTAPSRAEEYETRPLICGEDECIFFSNGESNCEAYDADGNRIMEWRDYVQMFFPMTCSLDKILIRNNGEGAMEVSSPRAGGVIGLFPEDEYRVDAWGDVFLVTRLDSGTSELFDSTGKQIGVTAAAMQEDPLSIPEEGTAGRLLYLEKGFLYGSHHKGRLAWAYASKDGQESYEIPPDSRLWEILENRELSALGNNLVDLSGLEEGQGRVFSLEGDVVKEHVARFIYDAAEGNGLYSIPLFDYRSITCRGRYFICLEGEEYVGYDRELNPVKRFGKELPENAGMIWQVGEPCEELGGRICTDTASGAFYRNYPSCMEDGNVLVGTKEGILTFPLKEGETLDSFNRYYYRTSHKEPASDGKEENVYRVYHIPALEPMIEYSWSSTVRTELGKDVLLVRSQPSEGSGSGDSGNRAYTNTFHGPDGRVISQYQDGFPRPLPNGAWYLSRGIYDGLADVYGNWIMRRINYRFTE